MLRLSEAAQAYLSDDRMLLLRKLTLQAGGATNLFDPNGNFSLTSVPAYRY